MSAGGSTSASRAKAGPPAEDDSIVVEAQGPEGGELSTSDDRGRAAPHMPEGPALSGRGRKGPGDEATSRLELGQSLSPYGTTTRVDPRLKERATRCTGVVPGRQNSGPEEDEQEGAIPVVVIGHDVWHSRFLSDPAIVGRRVVF